MITIKYEHKDNRFNLCVDGHATSAPKGEDVICAGVSTLTITLAQALTEHSPEWLDKCVIRTMEGHSTFEIVAKKDKHYKVSIIFDTILAGYQLMWNTFPDYIQLSLS